ncbi:MAG: rRNA maturation RNase YbeY [Firmicutes bacterium]|nr:rRNA maturation RNase YbeY [Bacillota bacterium]
MIERVCAYFGIDPNAVLVNLHIITADEMREVNREQRGLDKTTDVLSFPMIDFPSPVKTADDLIPHILPWNLEPESGKLILGEILVNQDETETAFLTIHGMLHLLGHTHDTDADYDAMMKLTKEIQGEV